MGKRAAEGAYSPRQKKSKWKVNQAKLNRSQMKLLLNPTDCTPSALPHAKKMRTQKFCPLLLYEELCPSPFALALRRRRVSAFRLPFCSLCFFVWKNCAIFPYEKTKGALSYEDKVLRTKEKFELKQQPKIG